MSAFLKKAKQAIKENPGLTQNAKSILLIAGALRDMSTPTFDATIVPLYEIENFLNVDSEEFEFCIWQINTLTNVRVFSDLAQLYLYADQREACRHFHQKTKFRYIGG